MEIPEVYLGLVDQIKQLLTIFCAVGAGSCALRALAILSFRAPARASVIFDGYRRSRRERDAAIFHHERAPMPLTVLDKIAFVTRDGQAIRVTKRRIAIGRDAPFLVWYSPQDPRRIVLAGPLQWLGWSLASLGGLAFLHLS